MPSARFLSLILMQPPNCGFVRGMGENWEKGACSLPELLSAVVCVLHGCFKDATQKEAKDAS